MSPDERETTNIGETTSAGQGERVERPPGQQNPPAGRGLPRRTPLTPALRRKSPATAGILSGMPGLGQVYVGHYQRGFIHLIVVGTVISLLSSVGQRGGAGLEPLLGMFIAFFWIYNIIDAVRLANFYNEAAAGASLEELQGKLVLPGKGGSLVGGIVLVGVGVVLILNTVFGVSLLWLQQWWPLIPVGFGVYLIYKGLQERKQSG